MSTIPFVRATGSSPRAVQRAFAHAGLNGLHALIERVRIARAFASLQAGSGRSLQTVADDSGYVSLSTLTDNFHQVLRMSPRQAQARLSCEECVDLLTATLLH
jgi:AraC-like DNA-binding protein